MPGEEEHFEVCQECGATIYPEHLDRQVAEKWEGKLLCPFCLREKRSASTAGIALTEKAASAEPNGTGESVALVELETGDAPIAYDKKPTAIRSFGGDQGGLPVGATAEHKYQRALVKGSPNATRCRTFHCKLADGPIAYMSEQINEWADAHDDVEIKFATSTIGVVEGKHVDPHLIVTVFY